MPFDPHPYDDPDHYKTVGPVVSYVINTCVKIQSDTVPSVRWFRLVDVGAEL